MYLDELYKRIALTFHIANYKKLMNDRQFTGNVSRCVRVYITAFLL